MLNRIKNLLRLGVVSSPGNDQGQLPSQTLDYHGKEGDAVPWYPYGMHAVAEGESYALVISMNANGEERICIPTSMLKRPNGAVGDVFLFHPLTGTQIKLDASGNVIVNATGEVQVNSPTLVKITSPEVEIVGNLDVSGNVGIGGDTEMTGKLDVLSDTQLTLEVLSGTAYIGGRHKHLWQGTGDSYTDGPLDE